MDENQELMDEFFTFTVDEKEYFERNNRQKSVLLSPFATKNEDATYFDSRSIRKRAEYSNPFISDCDRILNNVFYNRYTDKTQVFSFYRNDDITRRGSHVQLVSRIARTIGGALNLNLDLIEAIALGHDIGHTPFGHRGETMLSELYHSHCGKYFNHNVHSFRVLHDLNAKDGSHGLTIQTLDGILCHNGEKVHEKYQPSPCRPDELLAKVAACYIDKSAIKTLRPSTLEGCVVRISDIIAYVGKDRQDLAKIGKGDLFRKLSDNNLLGKKNYELIPRLTTNIIKNSIDKPYIGFSTQVYTALDSLISDNYANIYALDAPSESMYATIQAMMTKLYDKFLDDIEGNITDSSVFRHHLASPLISYNDLDTPDDKVVDYIASMTDDYFIDIYKHYFGEDELYRAITYIAYDYDLPSIL